jgi:alanine-synthesizing transaminase
MRPIIQSHKLDNVCYDIRGPIMQRAQQMEADGQRIIKLNIGNLAAFKFEVPEEMEQDLARNISQAGGYTDSKGIFSARKAIQHDAQQKNIKGVTLDDIIVGNGVSELIGFVMQGLLNPGDEVLVPSPDYPLWTAATSLASGTPVHYLCEEENGWNPSISDIRAKVTPNTKAIVVINPNNPTGAIYSTEVLLDIIQVARENGLVVMVDEIYDKVLYDGHKHVSMASLANDVFFITMGGLSKNYRACGYRAGWMILSGAKEAAKNYIEGLVLLASMRLCANAPGQHAIQTALGGYQSINDLIAEGGRLRRQRDLAYDMITAIPGVSCVKPNAAMYLFPKLDPKIYPIQNDQEFVLEFLEREKVLVVQGTGFNWVKNDHLRFVFLPHEEELKEAIKRFARFLAFYRERAGTNHLIEAEATPG